MPPASPPAHDGRSGTAPLSPSTPAPLMQPKPPFTPPLRRRLVRAIALSTPYHADMLDITPARSPAPNHTASHTGSVTLPFVVPHAAFVRSPHSQTVLTSVPPSVCQGRPSLLVLPALPSHTPPPSTVLAARRARLRASPAHHRRLQHPRQPLSTAHATFIASPRALAILSAVPIFAQSLPLVRITNTRRTTRTPFTSPAHALLPYSASHTFG
jgi:hypothetical protein